MPRLLVVEDDQDIVRILKLLLLPQNFEVDVVMDGDTALQYLKDQPAPDLLLLDFNLPGASGFDIIRYIRQQERLEALKVIGLTANRAAPSSEEGQLADLLLMKPFQNQQLLTMIDRLLGQDGK